MITLIGHGYVGTHIAEQLTSFNWITHEQEIPDNTDFIINAGGYVGVPNVDACEKNKMLCMDANVIFPLALERKTTVPILHITSGCVYTGYKPNGWLETDEPNFNFQNGSFYSGCKGLLQKLIEPYLSKSYLFRIRMPFGTKRNAKNLLTKYETYSKLINFENSVTQMEELIDCVKFFSKERPPGGIYNVCSPGSTSTKEIVKLLGIEKEWMSESEFESITSARRSNCTLNVSKLNAIYKLRPVEEALSQTIKKYKECK